MNSQIKTHLASHYVTGGASARDMAFLASVGRKGGPHWVYADAGGPLDAPEVLPAGSCNSTDVRTGPWHLNDGMGQFVPAQSVVRRSEEG